MLVKSPQFPRPLDHIKGRKPTREDVKNNGDRLLLSLFGVVARLECLPLEFKEALREDVAAMGGHNPDMDLANGPFLHPVGVFLLAGYRAVGKLLLEGVGIVAKEQGLRRQVDDVAKTTHAPPLAIDIEIFA